MRKLTDAEAKMKAAEFALNALVGPWPGLKLHYGDDWPAIENELRLIDRWLRGRATGGDKTLGRHLNKETFRQVRPSAKLMKLIERAKKTGGG